MTKDYFPSQPRDVRAFEARYRSVVKSCPDDARYALYSLMAEAHPSLVEAEFQAAEDFMTIQQAGETLFFPRPIPLVIMSHIVFGYETWLKHKYSLPGFVQVEQGDVVIDCGAYVGGFSFSAAQVAKSVHVFEPERKNFRATQRNLAKFENVVVSHCGLYSHNQMAALNISESSVEHSLLSPDDGDAIGTETVKLERLDTYCAQSGLSCPDFVKIEAEGVELEVFEGLGDLRPSKIAIDVSPERNGLSPAEAFKELLLERRYEVRRRGNVMFAKRADASND